MLWKVLCLTLQSMGRTNHTFPAYATQTGHLVIQDTFSGFKECLHLSVPLYYVVCNGYYITWLFSRVVYFTNGPSFSISGIFISGMATEDNIFLTLVRYIGVGTGGAGGAGGPAPPIYKSGGAAPPMLELSKVF